MAYAAAKVGVVQLSRDLGVHMARSGVRVNAVLFGPIDTADQRAVFDRNPGALDKRLVPPARVARAWLMKLRAAGLVGPSARQARARRPRNRGRVIVSATVWGARACSWPR
jgi:NAD(P)-dependent dehydrogenase (short-subunit alcohol dehydrogenase family)